MLEDITQDGMITWYCQAREFQDDPPCGILNTASLDEVVYQEMPEATKPGRGAMILLPACACGTRTSLKADYTVKELYKTLICYEEGGMRAYLLPLRYVHNLHVHFLLYQCGKAAYAPVLEMPPQALLEHPSFASIKPSTVYALWFGFATMRQHAPQKIEASTVHFLEAANQEVTHG